MRTALGVARGLFFLAAGMALSSSYIVSALLACAGIGLLVNDMVNQ